MMHRATRSYIFHPPGKMEYLSGTLAGDQPTTACGLAMALYFVLRAYSGWTQLNVVVGELQEPSR